MQVKPDQLDLPKAGEAASVDILDIVPPALKEILLDPKRVRITPLPSMEGYPRPWPMVARADAEELRDRLVSCGLCDEVQEDELAKDPLGRPILSGVFAVPKPSGRQRLIIDMRPANWWFHQFGCDGALAVEGRTDVGRALAYPSQLMALALGQSDHLHVNGEDLSNYFYLLKLPGPWRRFFGLRLPVADGRGSRCLRLKAVPMGWAGAVAVAQAVARATFALPNPRLPLLRADGPFPVNEASVAIPYLDDWNQISVCSKEGCGSGLAWGTTPEQVRLRAHLDAVGLPVNATKSVLGVTTARVLGLQVGGRLPAVAPAPRESARLLCASAFLAAAKAVSPKAVERWTGRYVFGAQVRRPILSVLESVYTRARRKYGPLHPEARLEILTGSGLFPQAHFPLRTKVEGDVWATDASSEGGGICKAPMPPEVARQWRAHLSFKGGHVVLKTGTCFGKPGLGAFEWPNPDLRWREVRGWPWRRPQHINVLEARAILALIERWAREVPGPMRRHILTDSQVCLFAFAKGRSSSRQLNWVLRRAAAAMLVSGCFPSYAYIRSEDNPADEPSRRLRAVHVDDGPAPGCPSGRPRAWATWTGPPWPSDWPSGPGASAPPS